MSSNSSTSSSEPTGPSPGEASAAAGGRTIELRALRPTRAAVLALGLFFALRMLLAVGDLTGFYYPGHDEAAVFAHLETEHRLTGDSPEVLLMGTSRFIDLPDGCLAEELGLPSRDVWNGSHLSPSLWRNAALIRRNPELVARARVIVIDALPLHFYGEAVVGTEIFYRHATLRERWLVRDPKQRMWALLDWLVPVRSGFKNVREWGTSARELSLPFEERAADLALRSARRKEAIWRLGAIMNFEPGDNINVVNYMAPDAPVSRLMLHAFHEMLDALPDDAVLVLTTLPSIGEVGRRIEQEPEVVKVYDRFEKLVKSVDDPRVHFVRHDDAAEWGLERPDYHKDGAHFTDRGARKLCAALAGIVEHEAPSLTLGVLP